MKNTTISFYIQWITISLLAVGWFLQWQNNKWYMGERAKLSERTAVAFDVLQERIEKLTSQLDNAKGYIERVNADYGIEPFGFVSNIYSDDRCMLTQIGVNYFDEPVLFDFGYSWVTGEDLP